MVPAIRQRAASKLQFAISRLEHSREKVIRILESLHRHGDQVVGAVSTFRTAWEALDLEFHFLAGEPLSIERYRRRLAPDRSRSSGGTERHLRRPGEDPDYKRTR